MEVLSPSTEGIDRREKLGRYLTLPSLEGYLLVNARERRVELYRKEGDILHQVAEEGEVPLPCLEGSLPVAEVYAGVELEGQEA